MTAFGIKGPQVNNTPAIEREGFDRTFLTLPGQQARCFDSRLVQSPSSYNN